MQRKRFDEIDFLRAFGIIGVIVVHILTYSLTNPLNKFLWNNLQFVVISFVFCSGFVLSAFYKDSLNSVSKIFSWYKKRFIRLVIPFYIYLIAHYSLWILFPNFFSGLGLSKSLSYFVKSAIFIGGTNFNWLPLLFLQLTFLFPIFINIFHKKKILFAYIVGCVFITSVFTLFVFPYAYYRLVMWVPWSLVLLIAIYFSFKEKLDKTIAQTNTRYFIFGITTFLIFLNLFIAESLFEKSLNFYNHKYPPDFYYLFFGISLTCFALLIGKMRIWQNKTLKTAYLFISTNSYQLFFIHYIIFDAVLVSTKHNLFMQNPLVQFAIILPLSVIIVLILNKILALRKQG